MKKIILLLVDSLMPSILEDCMQQRTVPALQFLVDRGRYWSNCITSFPTMTASVDSSLVTGVYPDVHRVPGLIWFDPQEKEIINYVNGWKCVRKLGLSNCTQNVLYNLNEKHLSKQVSTIFEELAMRGRTSGSINAMVHRSVKKHRVRLPFLLNLSTRFRFHDHISGPDVMTLGAMVQTDVQEIPKQIQGFKKVYGINDDYAVSATKSLIRSGNIPEFLLVYLPDNDHRVHKKNPNHAEESLIQVDKCIQQILNTFSSWDEALNQYIFIVTSDHGQTRIGNGKEFNIDLDSLLEHFKVLQLGEDVKDHDIVVCNNERMAYIYPLKPEINEQILRRLLSESRIDIIATKENEGIRIKEGGSGREVYFKPNGPYTDIYGSTWTINGEWEVLDLRLNDGVVDYGDYPDGLSRLYGAMYSQEIPVIVVTTRPRYEFKSRFYPVHLDGGSHGSLHKYDSTIPLIITGTEHRINEPPRLIDLKYFIINIFESSVK
ncbi:MAG TPA: alkaline phosphatase family protein [Bacillus sp. (in: firmicutes)]|nr:alkaline phosphatase family protein [Bacillus sp. (in: firmicutes)]